MKKSEFKKTVVGTLSASQFLVALFCSLVVSITYKFDISGGLGGGVIIYLLLTMLFLYQFLIITKFEEVDEKWIEKRKKIILKENWLEHLDFLIAGCEVKIEKLKKDPNGYLKVPRVRKSLELLKAEKEKYIQEN